MSTLFVVVSHFVEIVLIELSDEAGEVAMLEMFWEDRFGESFVLQRESDAAIAASLVGYDAPRGRRSFRHHPPI